MRSAVYHKAWAVVGVMHYLLLPTILGMLIAHGSPIKDTLWLYVLPVMVVLLFTAVHYASSRYYTGPGQASGCEGDILLVGLLLTVLNLALAASVAVYAL